MYGYAFYAEIGISINMQKYAKKIAQICKNMRIYMRLPHEVTSIAYICKNMQKICKSMQNM